MLKKYQEKLFENYKLITIALAIAILIIPLEQYLKNSFNNFTIFQHSTFHFFQKLNLYVAYPKEYYDYYLYNPTFPILFTPLAYLPTLLGMYVLTVLAIGLFYVAVRSLPFNKKSKLFILYFTFLEVFTSAICMQTNLIICASILFAFSKMERKESFKSAFFVNLGFVIKAYGAISGAFYVLKKPSLKRLLFLFLWFIILCCLPLLFYSPSEFVVLYKQWFISLNRKFDVQMGGLSVMSFMASVCNYHGPVLYTQCFGICMLLGTMLFIVIKNKYEDVKYIFLAYTMIWVIIFNHASESPTYVIAATGAAIWYLHSRKSVLDKILIITTFILTVMSPSDLFPRYVREHFVRPYSLKVFGPMLILLRIQISILFSNVKSCNSSSTIQPA